MVIFFIKYLMTLKNLHDKIVLLQYGSKLPFKHIDNFEQRLRRIEYFKYV